MNGLKKTTAAALAAACALSLTGCDASWIAKGGNTTLPAGVYVSSMLQNYLAGYQYLGPAYLQMDGVSENLVDAAEAYSESALAYLAKAQEMGITLTEEEEAEALADFDAEWSSLKALYEANRITEDSLKITYRISALADKVFQATYGEGGEKAVSTEELQSIYDDYYLKAGLMIFDKPSKVEPSEDATDEQKKELENTYNTSMAELEAEVHEWVSKGQTLLDEGQTFNDVIIAYDFEHMDLTSDADNREKVDTGNRYAYMDRRSENLPTEVVDYLVQCEKDQDYGKIKVIETDEYEIIVCAQDKSADPQDFELMRNNILYDLKAEEMQNDMADYTEALNIQWNEAAKKRFTPEKLVVGQ